ncbi:hypothetical protein L596_016956 [Steinernema carpocapsae]|uniref:Uncharacterized protein n=1 Tax=Steinernema carpocapsae TaxID=34508 RepID=A0A4U5N0Y2_STECR|nr:hypothetical protein L596_016956 [Steinernema carpocapsae]
MPYQKRYNLLKRRIRRLCGVVVTVADFRTVCRGFESRQHPAFCVLFLITRLNRRAERTARHSYIKGYKS